MRIRVSVLALCGLGLVIAGGTAGRMEASPRTEVRSGPQSGSLSIVVSPATDARKLQQLKRSLEAMPGVRRVFLGATSGDAVELQMLASAQIDGQAVQTAAQQLGFTVRGMSVANASSASGFQSTRSLSTVGTDPFSASAFALGRHWFGSENFRAVRRRGQSDAPATSGQSNAGATTGADSGSRSNATSPGTATSSSTSSASNSRADSSSSSSSGTSHSSSSASSAGSSSSTSSSSFNSAAAGTGSGASATAGPNAAASTTATAEGSAFQGPVRRVAFLAGPVRSDDEASQLRQTFATRPGVKDIVITATPGRRGVAQVSLAVDGSATAQDIRAAAQSLGITLSGTN